MAFIDDLMKGGEHFEVAKDGAFYALTPKGHGEEAVKLFQPIVETVKRRSGEGYWFENEHITSECGIGWADKVWIERA